jgi:hypothetical protein
MKEKGLASEPNGVYNIATWRNVTKSLRNQIGDI